MNQDELQRLTRRALFRETGYGLGKIALSSLLLGGMPLLAQAAPPNPMAPKRPPLPAKAKRIIYLFMAGAPSQVDLFDSKPVLAKYDGQECPDELLHGETFAFIRGRPKLLGSPFKFQQYGETGQWMSELFPNLRNVVDELTIIRSMHTDQFNHAPAQLFMNTGFQIPGRPSLGSWMTYGLGTENQDLPGFVVLISGQNAPDGGKSCWSSGFLPTVNQGIEFRTQGEPVLYVDNPDGVSSDIRRETLDALRDLNGIHHDSVQDPEIDTRISQYELAYRMQSSVPELMEISKESPETIAAYGAEPGKRTFANNCLLARRLAERGVRFIQLYHRGWDHHGTGDGESIDHGLPRLTREVDQPMTTLIQDLKQRGMLDDTIIIWGGEFGRTPMNEGRGGSPFKGRDHHPRAFTMFVAGGGFKPGTYGETDELGYNIASNPVHVHDLHATLLHQMGFDHTQLTYPYQGRNFRLTDVSGEVLRGLIK